MKKLNFATSNKEKLRIAQTVCAQAGITIVPVDLDVDEIQGEDPEVIVADKARRAYEQLGRPVVVSDDSWEIKALKGFPGPYMKSINHWFTPDDFLRLMSGIEDRRIILHQHLAYTDGKIVKIFKNSINGQLAHEPQGKNDKIPAMTITVLDIDNGKTLAEVFEQGAEAVAKRYKNHPDVWHGLVEWCRNSKEQ